MALVLNQWVVVGQASQTKAVQTSSGLINFTLTYFLEAKLTSQNVELNRSYGEVRARVTRSGGATYSSSMTATCSNCNSFSGVVTPEAILTTGSFELIGNDEGESALHLVGTLTAVVGGFSISVDAWAAAPTIPRASSLTFDTDEITLNGTNQFNITVNRASSSFTHTIKFARGSASYTLTGVGDSTTWQPSVSRWMPVCNQKKNSITVTLTTYSGSTKIGDSKTYTLYLNVDQTAYKPVISSITLSDTNTETSAVESNGSYIKGRSNLKAVVVFGVSNTSYVSLVGATITCGSDTRSITLSGTSSTQTVTFTGISSSDFRVTVTDARGVTATSTRTLTIIPYTNINITSASYTRVNDSGESTEVGNHIKLKVVTSGFVGTFGQSANVQTLSFRYKVHSSSTWSAWIQLGTYSSSTGGSVTTHTFNVQPTQTFSYSNQYDVQVRVVDQFSSKTLSIVIHQGLPITAYAANHFDVFGDFHIHDREDPTKYTSIGAVGYMPPAVVLTDCDDATQYGVRYRATNTTANTPITAYFHIYVFPYSTNYMTQVAFHTNTQGSRMWVRSNNDSGWGAWREVAVKADMKWTLLGSATASNAVSFNSSGYAEIMLVLEYQENTTYKWATSTTIPVTELGSDYLYCMMPARIAPSTGADFGGVVRIKSDSANTFEFLANRASVSPTLKVYAR